MFLCSKYISTNSSSLNQYKKLIDFDEFVANLHNTFQPITYQPHQPSQILEQKEELISNFQNHIEEEKTRVRNSFEQLETLYKNKCSELISSLEGVLEREKSIFEDNYNKLNAELQTDLQVDSHIPNFDQVREKVAVLKDTRKVQDYLTDALKRRRSWESATDQIKGLNLKSQKFYESLITSQVQKMPVFSKAESIINQWNEGLSNLIESIKQTAGSFEGLFEPGSGIQVLINNTTDIFLLTNDMVKTDTHLVIDFSYRPLNDEISSTIGNSLRNLTNLRSLTLNLQSAQLSEKDLQNIVTPIENLKNLRKLTINFQGLKHNEVTVRYLVDILPDLQENLTSLELNVGFCNLNDNAAAVLSHAVGALVNLRHLTVDLKCNQIKEWGGKAWGDAVSKLRRLWSLNLDFSGYSQAKNQISDEGASGISRSLKNLVRLQSLQLNFGHCSITDSTILELTISIRDLQALKDVSIQLHNNQISNNGSHKISKALGKSKVIQSLYLNLNSNNLQDEKAREIVTNFRSKNSIRNLTLYLRNNGVTRITGEELKNNLIADSQYELLEVHY